MALMQGFCWPLSAEPGEVIEFRTATTSPLYRRTFVYFENRKTSEVSGTVIANGGEFREVPVSEEAEARGQTQSGPDPGDLGCGSWDVSFTLTIPDWESGIYAAKCTELNSDGIGETFYIVFVVNPVDSKRNALMLLANVTTWNAYNLYGGRSRYTPTGGGDYNLSFLRPNPYALSLTIPDSSDTELVAPEHRRYSVGETSRHLARAEMWVLSWIKQAGFGIDVYTDLDFHYGITNLRQYAAIVLSTHPEYWTVQMMQNLKSYLDKGGNLLYLGGNGIFDAVDLSEDGTVITVHGTVDDNDRTRMFRNSPVNMPESSVLGVAYVNNTDSRSPYKVSDTPHRFKNGVSSTLIGVQGWNNKPGSTFLTDGAASGFEVDQTNEDSADGILILAAGQNENETPKEPGAQMTYYDDVGGGFVFSVGSITFGGSLVVDGDLQRIVTNALNECIGGWSPFFPIHPESTFQQGNVVTTIARKPDQIDLFTVGFDGVVYTTFWNPDNAWNNWIPIHPESTFRQGNVVTAIARKPDQIDLFTVGFDGVVYTTFWNPDKAWNNWIPIHPESTFRQGNVVTAIARKPDQIDLFTVGFDGVVYTTFWNPDNAWNNWIPIHPESTFQQGNVVTTIARKPDQIDLFTVGFDGVVYTTFWNPDKAWNNWIPIHPESTFRQGNVVTAIARKPDQIDLFTVGFDGVVYTTFWNPDNAWNNWIPIHPESTFRQGNVVTAIARKPDQIDLFTVGFDGVVWTTFWRY